MRPALVMEGVDHFYGATQVLDDFSISVQESEFLIILGPNGSGKSTLLKVINGMIKAKNGQIRLFGHLLPKYSRKDLARMLALVPQVPPTNLPFTVKDVVLMGRSPHLGLLGLEGRKDRAIAEEAMHFTGVADLRRRKLNQLSAGECQRVFIARAICQQPRIILLDEPTASLDLAFQIQVMDLMEKLRQDRGTTVIMVSHDINLAAMYADRLVLVKGGKMVSCGSPWEVLTFETLEKTYGCVLLIDQNPLAPVPRVTLVPGKFVHRGPETS